MYLERHRENWSFAARTILQLYVPVVLDNCSACSHIVYQQLALAAHQRTKGLGTGLHAGCFTPVQSRADSQLQHANKQCSIIGHLHGTGNSKSFMASFNLKAYLSSRLLYRLQRYIQFLKQLVSLCTVPVLTRLYILVMDVLSCYTSR